MANGYIISIKTWPVGDDSGWHPSFQRRSWLKEDDARQIEQIETNASCPWSSTDSDDYFAGECLVAVKLSGSDLQGQCFAGQRLIGADFSKANLTSSDFTFASALMADFSGARLYKSKFVNTELVFADFTGASMQGADLSGADLSKADLTGAILVGAQFHGSSLLRTRMTEADIRGADLSGVQAREVRWDGGVFDELTRLPFTFNEALSLGMIFRPRNGESGLSKEDGWLR